MSKKSIYLLGILLTILIGSYFYWKLCCDINCCGDADENIELVTEPGAAENKATLATTYPFAWRDGTSAFSTQDNFNFDVSGFQFLRPVSGDVNEGIDELQLYLNSNPNKAIDITGLYLAKEENTSAFLNLGMARANAVKNYLITKGIPSSKMNLFGKLNDQLVPAAGVYKGPILYGISTLEDISEGKEKTEMATLRDKIRANPLVLNFATAQTSINLTAAQRQKIADIARYLDKVENGKAIVEGHTDNTGSKKGNINISKKRADFAKNYLIENLISPDKIEAVGKGSNEPIASNTTEEGRAQNRRTVVTVN